jgi:hypothetical protein
MSKKEVLASGMSAKLTGWRKICKKYAEMEVYGYSPESGECEPGSVSEQFCIMLDAIDRILRKF